MEILRGYVFESQGHSIPLTEIVKANILIDETSHACLADFGLLTITSDATNHGSSSSSTHGGTFRWMSPELFCPGNFGLKDSRRTKRSDCYALGMVIYEVLSGQAPFHGCGVYAVVIMVNGGERPGRPRGVEGEWFANGVWGILERCWAAKPHERPRIENVLRCLEEVSMFWTPLSRMAATPPTADSPTRSYPDPGTEGSIENETPGVRGMAQRFKTRVSRIFRQLGSPSYTLHRAVAGQAVKQASEHKHTPVATPEVVFETGPSPDTIIIPDLVSYCDFSIHRNPKVETAVEESKAWLFEHDQLGEKRKNPSRGLKVGGKMLDPPAANMITR
jgi:hypothetical protein